MDPIRMLQSRAAEKRDQAIAEARRQYRKDIEAIDALEKQLPSVPVFDREQPLGKPPNITEMIQAVIPADQPFTITNVLGWLHEAHNGHKFHYPTVRTQTSRLCSRGFLRRLYKTGQMETMYARAESAVTEGPIETRGLAEVTHEILLEAGRPLKVSEIVVTMRERGYRAENVPNTVMRAVRDMFKRFPGRFVRGKDGRWTVV